MDRLKTNLLVLEIRITVTLESVIDHGGKQGFTAAGEVLLLHLGVLL